MAQREPKHVARSNNVKYTINPNNNHQLSCVRLYILQFIYLHYCLVSKAFREEHETAPLVRTLDEKLCGWEIDGFGLKSWLVAGVSISGCEPLASISIEQVLVTSTIYFSMMTQRPSGRTEEEPVNKVRFEKIELSYVRQTKTDVNGSNMISTCKVLFDSYLKLMQFFLCVFGGPKLLELPRD